MPRGPKDERRPTNVISHAVPIGRIAEIEDARSMPESGGKNAAAVALGRMGGMARAAALGKRKRKEIARHAANQRWKKG
jgi:hypothetical protein